MLKFFSPVNLLEAGCDEAGRGCLAGPVFAAAVILPCDFEHSLLNDSKQMKEADRYLLRPIIEKESLAWAVGSADHLEIDSINILNASITAMHRAIANLKLKPELLLVDGNRFRPFSNIDFRCIVKGDAMYQSIAAASVLAKTYRDDFMNMLHQQYPQYGWNKNKAYATSFHRNAIKTYGESPFHRKSFRLKNRQTSLNLEF